MYKLELRFHFKMILVNTLNNAYAVNFLQRWVGLRNNVVKQSPSTVYTMLEF